MTKRIKQMLITNFHRWQVGCSGTYEDIWQAYKKPSYRKIKIWGSWWEKLQLDYEAGEVRIMSKNSQYFTLGTVGYIDGLLHFIYITPANFYTLPLEYINPDTAEIISINY